MFSGELFIGANLTAIALKNDRHLGKDPLVWIQLGYGDDLPRENGFPLFPNVQLRATLAVTCRQTLTNTNLAALGFKKVGCDIQKIFSVSLIVCLVSWFVRFQYRQCISRFQPTDLRGKFLISQNPNPSESISLACFRIRWISKRCQAIHYYRRNLYTRWFMDVHGRYFFYHIRKFTSPSPIR